MSLPLCAEELEDADLQGRVRGSRHKRVAKDGTDFGKEFKNANLKSLLNKHGINLYSTENEEKGSVIKRWNRIDETKTLEDVFC